MADTKCSETRRNMDTMGTREEAMCGARGDRFGVTSNPLARGPSAGNGEAYLTVACSEMTNP
jgi:hypothetical protein